MSDRPLESESYQCENEEWGEECAFPHCNCEEIDIFGKEDMLFDDLEELEEMDD